MKQTTKTKLSKLGIHPHLDTFRNFTKTNRWISAGCIEITPPIKRKILMDYLDSHIGKRMFIKYINEDNRQALAQARFGHLAQRCQIVGCWRWRTEKQKALPTSEVCVARFLSV